MFHSNNNRERYIPDREGKDERSRVEWFLFVHQLLDRFDSGKTSKREKQLLSSWVPLMEGQSPVSPNEKEEKDAERKIYRKISEHFSFVATVSNEPIPVQPEKNARSGILGNFPVVVLIIIVAGMGMYVLFNKKDLFPQFFSEAPPTGYVVLTTGEGEYKEFVLPDGTFVKMTGNTIISFCTDEFNKTTREVELIQGEVLFVTIEIEDIPFIVRSKIGSAMMRSPSFTIRMAEEGAMEIQEIKDKI